MAAFPDVKGKDIPREVWEAASQGENLTLAYSLHQNQALQRKLDALQRQRDNSHRTTGSQARHAPGTMRDLIAQWWNEGG